MHLQRIPNVYFVVLTFDLCSPLLSTRYFAGANFSLTLKIVGRSFSDSTDVAHCVSESELCEAYRNVEVIPQVTHVMEKV